MQPRFISNRGQKPNVDSTTSICVACEKFLSKSSILSMSFLQHSAITTVLLFSSIVLC